MITMLSPGPKESSRAKARNWPFVRHSSYEDMLRFTARTWFENHNIQSVNPRRPYILAEWEDWPRNIILPEVADYIKNEQASRVSMGLGFPLHKYIHHGLSSQAMIFNLVGPLIVHGNLRPLQRAFEEEGVYWPSGEAKASFEYEDRAVFNEDTGQPTSIDLIIKGNKDTPVLYVESKLVEREFGGCSVFADGDCTGQNPVKDLNGCYLHFIGRKYWQVMKKHGFLHGKLSEEMQCIFTVHYQFFRELLFALELGGLFILVYDARNPTFSRGVEDDPKDLLTFLLSFVPDEYRSRVYRVSIQKVVNAIKESERETWITEFEKKYGLV